jgi:dihydrofolate synthase / folylpolyglutamate synthase
MTIATLADAQDILNTFVPPPRSQRAVYDLVNIKRLMSALGNPQEKYQVIHVAGTSGKTSTCYYLADLSRRSGKRTGLSVSPHITSLLERVQIDGNNIDEQTFCRYLSQVVDVININKIPATYFEVMMAVAYYSFAQENIEVVVIETGLGGLLDGSNVVSNPSKVCVLTDIGFDHMNILGNTLSQIATQKAGIIQSGNKVYCYSQSAEVNAEFATRTERVAANLHIVNQQLRRATLGEGALVALDSMPAYQSRNWLLAYAVIKSMFDLELSNATVVDSMATHIPGRFEIKVVQGKPIIFDGAHNAQKMEALVLSLIKKYPGQKVNVLLALVSNKHEKAKETLRPLVGLIDSIIVTSFETQQDYRKVSMKPTAVVRQLESLKINNILIIDDPKQALDHLAKKEGLALVTGSFYLISKLVVINF